MEESVVPIKGCGGGITHSWVSDVTVEPGCWVGSVSCSRSVLAL